MYKKLYLIIHHNLIITLLLCLSKTSVLFFCSLNTHFKAMMYRNIYYVENGPFFYITLKFLTMLYPNENV